MDGKLKGNGSTRPALDVDIDAIWLEKQYHNQNKILVFEGCHKYLLKKKMPYAK